MLLVGVFVGVIEFVGVNVGVTEGVGGMYVASIKKP